jgi:hypothetical protein
MSGFSVRVLYKSGKHAGDVGVMISYHCLFGGFDERRTNSDGWVKFTNYQEKSGDIWVHGKNMGSDSLADGKTYSFSI